MTDVSKIASLILGKKNERRDFCTAQTIFFPFSFFFFARTMQHKVAQGKVHFCPAGYLVGTHFL